MIYFFFFNDTATTEIYTLSLHDALPISVRPRRRSRSSSEPTSRRACGSEAFLKSVQSAGTSDLLPSGKISTNCKPAGMRADRKSTRLNSSHLVISYAVFCLKKKIHARTQQRFALCARHRADQSPDTRPHRHERCPDIRRLSRMRSVRYRLAEPDARPNCYLL